MSDDALTISLKHWLDYIESIHVKSVDFDLSRVRAVAEKSELNQFECPVVIVGGTNGKGSTVGMLSKLLEASGLRVGSYYSPHLIRFNERVVINSQPCPEPMLCQAFAKVQKARAKTPLTFFEFTTLAAFDIFKQASLDILLLEVGCGGEFDAVNIVEPSLSIISSISLDHMEWLGRDIETIGKTKAGILRPNKPAILGETAQVASVLKHAESIGASCILEGKDFSWHDIYKSYWHNDDLYLKIPKTDIPSTSVSLSLAAYHVITKHLSLPLKALSYENLCLIMKHAKLPGRFQKVMAPFETYVDVAHNAAGAIWLANKCVQNPTQGKTIAVWSSLLDKDLKGIVEPLKAVVDSWVIAPIQSDRAATVEQLEQALLDLGVQNIEKTVDLPQAYKVAEHRAGIKDRILVFGSFYTVSEVLRSREQDHLDTSAFYVKGRVYENGTVASES